MALVPSMFCLCFRAPNGLPVRIVYPDQQRGGMGTLFIPNSLALIRGAPHLREARRLVDYLLSPAVEMRLARSRSAQIPLNREVAMPLRVETPATVRGMLHAMVWYAGKAAVS